MNNKRRLFQLYFVVAAIGQQVYLFLVAAVIKRVALAP